MIDVAETSFSETLVTSWLAEERVGLQRGYTRNIQHALE